MAFPADPLAVAVEIYVGGQWTDITSDVRIADGIVMTRGRADEASRPDPGRCTLMLNNRDGRYSPRNPTSPLYGQINRNTPVRVKVEGEVRWIGEISAWPPRWDVSGTDVVVPVEASGILRRLGQGADVVGSALYRGRLRDTEGLVAYWPCEDPNGSSSIAAALNHPPMTVIGRPDYAAYDGFPSSQPIPILKGSEWRGTVPAYPETGEVQVRCIAYFPAEGAESGHTVILVYTTGSVRRWELSYGAGGTLRLRAFDPDGTQLLDTGPIGFAVNGKRLLLSVELRQIGSAVGWNMLTLEPGAASGLQWSGTLSNNTIGRAGTVIISPTGGIKEVAVGHVSVQNKITSLFDLGDQLAAWVGEPAGSRIARLCREEGISFTWVGDLNSTALMGPQRPGQLLDLLFEAADADMGILYEPKNLLGIGYRTRESLYNQSPAATLDYAGGHIAPPLEPVDDDQALRNDITVSRPGGSSARAVLETGPISVQPPPAGVGRYDEEVQVSVYHDLDLPDQAGWRLRLGTVNETRYPKLAVNLTSPHVYTDSSLMGDLVDLDLGDLVVMTGLPAWLPPGDVSQIVQGYEEVVGPFEWVITANCTPGSPWTVGVYDGADSRYQPHSTVLASSVNASTTTIPIDTPVGPLWSTTANGYDILVGGERMTVVAVGSPSGTVQNLTVIRSVNGVSKSHAAGTPVQMFIPTVYAL